MIDVDVLAKSNPFSGIAGWRAGTGLAMPGHQAEFMLTDDHKASEAVRKNPEFFVEGLRFFGALRVTPQTPYQTSWFSGAIWLGLAPRTMNEGRTIEEVVAETFRRVAWTGQLGVYPLLLRLLNSMEERSSPVPRTSLLPPPPQVEPTPSPMVGAPCALPVLYPADCGLFIRDGRARTVKCDGAGAWRVVPGVDAPVADISRAYYTAVALQLSTRLISTVAQVHARALRAERELESELKKHGLPRELPDQDGSVLWTGRRLARGLSVKCVSGLGLMLVKQVDACVIEDAGGTLYFYPGGDVALPLEQVHTFSSSLVDARVISGSRTHPFVQPSLGIVCVGGLLPNGWESMPPLVRLVREVEHAALTLRRGYRNGVGRTLQDIALMPKIQRSEAEARGLAVQPFFR